MSEDVTAPKRPSVFDSIIAKTIGIVLLFTLELAGLLLLSIFAFIDVESIYGDSAREGLFIIYGLFVLITIGWAVIVFLKKRQGKELRMWPVLLLGYFMIPAFGFWIGNVIANNYETNTTAVAVAQYAEMVSDLKVMNATDTPILSTQGDPIGVNIQYTLRVPSGQVSVIDKPIITLSEAMQDNMGQLVLSYLNDGVKISTDTVTTMNNNTSTVFLSQSFNYYPHNMILMSYNKDGEMQFCYDPLQPGDDGYDRFIDTLDGASDGQYKIEASFYFDNASFTTSHYYDPKQFFENASKDSHCS